MVERQRRKYDKMVNMPRGEEPISFNELRPDPPRNRLEVEEQRREGGVIHEVREPPEWPATGGDINFRAESNRIHHSECKGMYR